MITDVGEGLIQFKFALESQLMWVMNNGPWSFDNHLLLLRRWEKGMMAFSVNVLHIPIWVQVISSEGDRVWVAFQYECLVGLCFNCGLLGHESKFCLKVRQRDGEDSPYGD